MGQVTSAQEATDIALAFVGQYFTFVAEPKSAHRENDTWTVEIDVGLSRKRIATVVVDATNGEIREYQVSA